MQDPIADVASERSTDLSNAYMHTIEYGDSLGSNQIVGAPLTTAVRDPVDSRLQGEVAMPLAIYAANPDT